MDFKLWLETPKWQGDDFEHIVWHITDIDSAQNILHNGFTPQKTDKGLGVSVSVAVKSAQAMLRSTQRMNSFLNTEDVIEWFVNMGAPREQVRLLSNNPAELYLKLMSRLHPAVGGSAKGIPWEEFLWVDFAHKLIGKRVVAVEATYIGRLKEVSGIEAEALISDQDVRYLTPEKILNKPEAIW